MDNDGDKSQAKAESEGEDEDDPKQLGADGERDAEFAEQKEKERHG
jgi:hypothetical protein